MIGVFSFDGPMYRDKNGVYCNTTITSEMLSRYLDVVDKLIVVIRTYHLDKTYDEASLKKVEREGIEFVEIPNINSLKGFLVDKRKYNKIILDQVKKADLIFARMPSVISDITIQYAKKNKKKYMVEVGGCAWDAFWNHGILGKLVAPYMFINERKGIKNASYATYVTEKWLQSRYPCNCPSIAASNVYLASHDSSVLKKRLNKINNKDKNEAFIIGTTAAVNVKYKGQEYIIRAISELNKRGYNFEYEMVGGGDNSYLKRLAEKLNIEDKIRFKGILLHEDVFNWLDSIDIYAQPSKQEGLPRALIEAMSRGCPSLGSETAGIPELLDKECIFRKGSVNEICKILMAFDNEKMKYFSNINYKKSQEFDAELIYKRRKAIYIDYAKSVM